MSNFLTFKTIDTVSLQFEEADSELELIMMTNVFSNSKQRPSQHSILSTL